jgi:hypothetical protein
MEHEESPRSVAARQTSAPATLERTSVSLEGRTASSRSSSTLEVLPPSSSFRPRSRGQRHPAGLHLAWCSYHVMFVLTWWPPCGCRALYHRCTVWSRDLPPSKTVDIAMRSNTSTDEQGPCFSRENSHPIRMPRWLNCGYIQARAPRL